MLVSLAAAVVLGPVIGGACSDIFWFFSYHLTVLPLVVVLPVFLLLGAVTPLAVYRWAARATVVERLREAEAVIRRYLEAMSALGYSREQAAGLLKEGTS